MNDPYNTLNYTYPASSTGYVSGGQAKEKKRLNLLELGLIFFSILVLVLVFLFTFFSQGAKQRDKQKEIDLQQVILALDFFYENSSTIPSKKAYPIAECSGRLNEVDYEFVLKQYLAGNRKNFDTHTYIKPQDFPSDKHGIYSQKLNQRQLNLRLCPKIFSNLNQNNLDVNIYPDGSQSCNFDISKKKYRKCYLYTSSTNGDKFELGYFSESVGGFVIYSRYRNQPLQKEVQRI